MIYFTADSHYDHENILKYCNRPFSNVKEMNEAMIENHNSVVKPNDDVYHLGDFTFKQPQQFLKQLNGHHYLIYGNHDKRGTGDSFVWKKDTYYLNIKDGWGIFLSHYAPRVWPQSHRGSIALYGHSHGKLEEYGRSFDVGVDCNNFTPVSIEDVIERAMKMKPTFCIKDLGKTFYEANKI